MPADPPHPSRPRPPHHGPRGFRNPPGSPTLRPGGGGYWRFIWRRVARASLPPSVPDGHDLAPHQALAGLSAANGADSLTWLGHAAFLVRLGGKTLLLDPFLGERAAPFRGLGPKRFVPPPIAVERLPPIDAVIVSHNHYDHLCRRTLDRLPGKERATAIVPLGLAPFLRRRGFRDVRELDWHQRTDLGNLGVTALPAIHWSRRKPWDTNRTLWASFALEADGFRLYFAGDTGYGPVFREIGAAHGPFDLALVPIGAYEPRSIMQVHHATPEEAVDIGRDLGAARLVAMHWGTIMLTDEPPFEPPVRFRAAAAAAGYGDDAAWIMRIGETRPLRPWPGN